MYVWDVNKFDRTDNSAIMHCLTAIHERKEAMLDADHTISIEGLIPRL